MLAVVSLDVPIVAIEGVVDVDRLTGRRIHVYDGLVQVEHPPEGCGRPDLVGLRFQFDPFAGGEFHGRVDPILVDNNIRIEKQSSEGQSYSNDNKEDEDDNDQIPLGEAFFLFALLFHGWKISKDRYLMLPSQVQGLGKRLRGCPRPRWRSGLEGIPAGSWGCRLPPSGTPPRRSCRSDEPCPAP